MRFASVCAGIDSASVAWRPLGWRAVLFSEIAPFPCAVLAHHYPEVPNLGDLNGFRSWPDAIFDVLVGGTPCQSFSVAGFRAGFADAGGNLALVYLEVLRRHRPRWFVWENVPGVLSSHGGRDFGSFIGGVAELGYGYAWRTLNARGFGVSQQRARVFVVGCAESWASPAAVLFEPESLRGNFETRRGSSPEDPPAVEACARDGRPVFVGSAEGPEIFLTRSNIGKQANNQAPLVAAGDTVRRFTALECERLQGFPDHYTAITYRGRPAADAPRYEAIGNAIAVPCLRWIGERIEQVAQL